MPFLLKRGGANVPLEVQRWQYFLLKNNVSQTGAIDAQFGAKTEEATKIFQVQRSLNVTGQLDQATLEVAQGLGYTVRPNNYYDDKLTNRYPPRPTNLSSPSNADRNAGLGCFKFKQLPRNHRGDPDEIVTLGSCDDSIADWRAENIIDIQIPQMKFVSGFSGIMRCHRLAARLIFSFCSRAGSNLTSCIYFARMTVPTIRDTSAASPRVPGAMVSSGAARSANSATTPLAPRSISMNRITPSARNLAFARRAVAYANLLVPPMNLDSSGEDTLAA
jgi:hypothetical protein